MIADLDRGSHSAAVALQLLATFRHVQDQNVAHRDRILEELEHKAASWRRLSFLEWQPPRFCVLLAIYF
jgi:hypothetical protein